MDEISPTNEIKKMQKGSTLPASSALPVKIERQGSVDAESKTKERRLSLLNVFKFQRRKSVKELPQEINSDCEKNSDAAISRPLIKSNNAVAIKGASAKDKREDLSQNKGIDCNSIEVGDFPKMALDEGQQKTGRWQHVRARLQHRIALPSKPEVNLGLDTPAKKKSLHRKLPVDLASLKMQLSSKSNHAGDKQTDNFVVSRQSAKLTDSSLKVPSLRKTSLPFLSFSAQSLCPSENMASDLDKAQHIRTDCTSSVHGTKPNQVHVNRLEAAEGDLFSVGKGHVKAYGECPGVDISSPLPAFSPFSRNSKNSDCIILDRKLNGNKNFIEDANIARHLSQLHISFQDDPSRISYSDENGTINKSPTNKQIPFSCISSVAQAPKRTASLPNIANSDDNIFEYTNRNNAEVTNVIRVETERNDSELVLNQNHAAFQNLQKKKRFSLAAYRDRNDLIHTGLHREDPSVVFKQRMSGEGIGILGRPMKIVSRDRHSISSAVMFTRKSHVDIKKSAQKILDSRKELLTRLKHLRVILESFDIAETKAYFEQYFSILYFLFHESFTNVETNLGQRVSKGHREELEFTILVLEKILTLLPDLIHKRWQLHSIGQIMKKLLHPGNSSKLRRDGIRLFVMWYGILMDNATEDCHCMFRSIIPQMLPSRDNCEMELTSGKLFPQTKVTVPDVVPLLTPQAGEVQPDEPCSWLLDCLLAYVASEASKIQWSNSEMQEHCLKFLFDKFKDHYLLVIFPNLAWKASVYEPPQDLPERILLSNGYDRTLALCQESVIKWIARYTLTASLQTPEIILKIPENNPGMAEAELVNPGSNASTLSVGSSWMDNTISGSNTDRNEESFVEQEIIQNVFYSSKENVNIIHEVLRQAFLCPFQVHRSQMVRQVITIYWSWFQNQEKPIFMQEPILKRASCSKYPNKRQSVTSASSGQMNYQLSAEDAETDVRAGLQRILRVFITNSSALFMFDNSFTDKDSVEQQLKLEDQVDICKKVLKMYRDIVTKIILDKTTWEQVLMVLLKVLSTTLSPTVSKENSLSGRLAESLFKTMMLAWLKANLCIVVSQQLWKNFTETLSSFTCCVHLIRQWSKTMELLTWILSQCIYDIDLRDLPLDKLNKRKVNRLHGAKDGLKRCEKESSLTRNLLEQLMGGVTSGRQKLLSSAIETDASKSDGSVRSVQLSGSQLNSISHQNTGWHSKCQSQFDLSFSKLSSNTDACNHHRRHLLRRNSDSNIVIESEKLEVSHLRVSDVEDHEAQQMSSDAKTDDVFHNDIKETPSHGCHVQSESAGECSSRLVGRRGFSSVTDCMSISSTDSSVLPYSALVNNSASCVSSSSGANVIEPNSCSDSDTEALLRTSDSGSGSSHGICQRSKFRSLSESNSYSKDTVLTEEDKEKGIWEEGIEEENLTAETAKGTVDDDGAAIVCDFEGKKVKQDRDSLQIDDDEAFNVLCSSISPASERQSVLQSGEHVSEWTPDVALVLWQRMLGCLGNVNEIKDSGIHRQVFEFLSDLLDIFIKIRDNQGVSKDNQTTPPEPTYVPPILMFSSWCFEAFRLSDDYHQGKLVAYQILCTSIMRRHDVDVPQDHLHRFFLVLHYGLTCGSQDVANVLIRCCNTKLFSRSLPGSTLLMLDFIRGANSVLSQPVKAKNVPRVEALSLLGSLLFFQNLLQEIPVLDPNSEDLNVVKCSDIKETILDILLKFTRIEPTGSSQCVAIDALGLYLYEELCHPGESLHPKLKAAFDILLSMLKLTDKAAVLTTTHVLSLLCDHMPLLLLKLPDLPCEVVKDITTAVAHFLTTAQSNSSEESKRTTSQILISMMFTMLEWCMQIPQFLLLSYKCQNDKFLLHLVFDALDKVVNGGKRAILSSPKTSRPLVTNDNQALSNETLPVTSAIDINQEINSPTQKAEIPDDDCTASPNKKPDDEDHDSCGLKSAAKAIIFHLINYLNHFPMSTFGATQMSSSVEEHHDTVLEAVEQSDLSAQLLASNNTQFFVINNCALISFVEVPIQMVDQNRETGGLATEKTVCRIVSRDPSGKHCWDSSILYGCQQNHSGPCPTDNTQMLQRIEEEEDAKLEESDLNNSPESRLSLSDEDLQSCANMAPEDDILNIMLQYLSESSPECLLYTGEALNASFHIPAQLNQRVEELVKDSMIEQQVEEKNYINLHTVDKYVTLERKESSEHCHSLSPFHLCRLFLSQFGFVTYEKRKNFDLLHKSEKLLRELKHLDNQRCRDTHKIAVIYVGPGQEDKVSILKNSAGSQSFNEFVSALGWQVNLQSHSGFMGGLQRNLTTGSTAPYYSTSTKEVIFHVSTLMPSETEEDQLRKLRHLGNDEVHIIWSEHKRDYRHGIIPTEFGDVLIVIYPLENGLFRIEIIQRPEVPSFGPLFNGAIVSFRVLPGLVRATAISAGQVLRTTRPHYQAFYEERMCCIDSIVKNYKLLTTFEAFSSQIFAPSPEMDAENMPFVNASLNQSQLQPLTKASKGGHKSRWRRASTDALFHRGEEDPQSTYRKLSLAGGKQKKLKKMQSVSTPPLPLSSSFDLQQIK